MNSAIRNYWTNNGDQVVHIYGACSHEGQEDARAGYATDWGPEDSRNKAGAAMGLKTQLRAELTALRAVLETAVESAVKKIFIRHKSDDLSEEFGNWACASVHEKNLFVNRDLLGAIEFLRQKLQVWIEPADPRETIAFKTATLLAKRVAGLHSTAAVPITDDYWEEGTRIVDIGGFQVRCNNEDKAGYGIYWGPNDRRNCKGHVFGKQNIYRAELTALRVALETAKSCGFDEVIIRSRGIQIHSLIMFKRKCGMVKNSDLLVQNSIILKSFNSVLHFLPPKSIDVPGLNEALRMAREQCGASKMKVSIYGMGTTDKNGITTYGIYWGPGNEMNQNGWIAGAHGDFCAELAALGTVLQLSQNQNSLKVDTNSDCLINFVNERRHELRQQNWSTPFDMQTKCMQACKTVDTLLENRLVNITYSTDDGVTEARKLAESANGCFVVQTAGIFLDDGNNESVASYGVYWSPNDEKNEHARVPGIQSSVRAKLWAIRRALEIAAHNGIRKLVVYTDYRSKYGHDKKLELEIKILAQRMEHLKYQSSQSNDADKLATSSLPYADR